MAITTGSLIISWGDCSWLTQWFQSTQQGLGHNCSLLVSLHFNPVICCRVGQCLSYFSLPKCPWHENMQNKQCLLGKLRRLDGDTGKGPLRRGTVHLSPAFCGQHSSVFLVTAYNLPCLAKTPFREPSLLRVCVSLLLGSESWFLCEFQVTPTKEGGVSFLRGKDRTLYHLTVVNVAQVRVTAYVSSLLQNNLMLLSVEFVLPRLSGVWQDAILKTSSPILKVKEASGAR